MAVTFSVVDVQQEKKTHTNKLTRT